MFTNIEKKESAKRYGTILHIDGDKKYAQKAIRYYQKLRLHAIVKNIPENNQPNQIKYLLKKYNPNILIITGHDKMYQKEQDIYEINNYKNSKFFIHAVEKARQVEPSPEKLIIFAGACESFYEAILYAGANFASSPARTKIEYSDPLTIASKIAMTSDEKYVKFTDIKPFLKSSNGAIDGSRARGQKIDRKTKKDNITTM